MTTPYGHLRGASEIKSILIIIDIFIYENDLTIRKYTPLCFELIVSRFQAHSPMLWEPGLGRTWLCRSVSWPCNLKLAARMLSLLRPPPLTGWNEYLSRMNSFLEQGLLWQWFQEPFREPQDTILVNFWSHVRDIVYHMCSAFSRTANMLNRRHQQLTEIEFLKKS